MRRQWSTDRKSSSRIEHPKWVLEHAQIGREPCIGLTCNTIAPWTTPRTGGRSLRPVEMSWSTAVRSTTSQLRTTMFAPSLLRLSICARALPRSSPLRESRTIFFAPLEIIHDAMLRPRPPVPPIKMYVESSRNNALRFLSRGAYESLAWCGLRPQITYHDDFIVSGK